MRENRLYGSEGGEGSALLDPYCLLVKRRAGQRSVGRESPKVASRRNAVRIRRDTPDGYPAYNRSSR